ncbi:MAG: PAS domain S-box-containing protein [Arenicella sp.]|jgi:PAS domain S-box-containing protein
MNYFSEKWNRFIDLGTSGQFDFSGNRRVRMLNATALAILIMCVVLSIQGFLSKRYVPALINLSRVIISVILLVLTAKGKFKTAVILLISLSIISTVAFVCFVPYQTGSSLSFFVIYSLIFYFLNSPRKVLLVFLITFFIGCFSFYYEYNVLPNKFPLIHVLSFSAISTLIFLIFNYYRKEGEAYRKRIEKSNNQLQEQHAIISQQKEEISSQRDDIQTQNKSLKRERKRLKETQEISKLGSWEFDISTGEADWSEIAYNIMGLKRENASPSAQDYLELLTPEDQKNMIFHQQRLIKKGIPYEIEVAHERPDGITVHLLLNANRLTKYGKTTKVLGTMVDITERKKNEARLQALNESKDRILGTVAHDLRNPIHNIQGMVDILQLQLRGKVVEQDEQIFSMMKKSCKRALTLINELLEISKLEDENFEMKRERVDLNEFLGLELAVFLEEMKAKELEFVLSLSEQETPVLLNSDSFQRVLSNLLSNAIKFTPRQGIISVSVHQEGDSVGLTISDTGIGIPKDLQANLFEKFSEASRTGLEGEKSTGLGMSIVKQIIKLHQGTIDFKSKEGKGTSFKITLPLERELTAI